MRLLSCAVGCALFVTAGRGAEPKPVQAGGNWVTIKGQIVLPENVPIPKRQPLNVNVNANVCLKAGPILDESVIVNPKNRGIKNVVVWLRPDNANNPKANFQQKETHPADAKRKAADVVIDQPCCMFTERVTCARVGDTIIVKNPAPIVHNFLWSSQENGEFNANVPANAVWRMPNPLVAEGPPIQYKCTIHPWMTGYVRIFDHPYYAVTDDDGKFEVKDAPAGRYRIVVWHENGLLDGAKGRFGRPIVIAGVKAAAGWTMEMKPIDFDVTGRN
jgi:hypothetical protein